jgi:RimJ/RimL family protein N-acetyltransferase
MTTLKAIETARLRLAPLDANLARLQAEDREAFFSALGVEPEPSWPPERFEDVEGMNRRLSVHPEEAGWRQWVFISPILNRLVGAAAFTGPPNEQGLVEISYAMLNSYREQGLATEAVMGMVDWAYDQPGVSRILAETVSDGLASRRVLEKSGFEACGPVFDDGRQTDLYIYKHERSAGA